MGTTLTGTTPQDTYDSLIKVTDNGPLSGTAKYLSDGLGNDSVLALSNAQVGIGSTTLGTNYPLTIRSATADYTKMLDWGTSAGGSWGNMTVNIDAPYETILTSGGWVFKAGGSERLRITSAGNVGIGTSSPAQRLDISNGAIKFDRITTGALTCNDAQGLIYSIINNTGSQDGLRYTSRTHRFVSHADASYATIDADGLKFGSDTAAANALDDYEEGTFTPTLTFGGASVGMTTNEMKGRYVKIGRQVFINGFVSISSKGSSTGNAVIGGLPFTVFNDASAYDAPAIRFNGISFTGQYTGFVSVNSTNLNLNQTSEAGTISDITDANFTNSGADVIIFSLSYPVS